MTNYNEIQCSDCGNKCFNGGLVRRGKVWKCEDCWEKPHTMKYLDDHVPLYHAFVPPKKTWQDTFREEFGIHFSESELQFAIAFIEEREAEVREEAYKAGYIKGGIDGTGKPLLEVENVRIVGGANAGCYGYCHQAKNGESFTCCCPCCK